MKVTFESEVFAELPQIAALTQILGGKASDLGDGDGIYCAVGHNPMDLTIEELKDISSQIYVIGEYRQELYPVDDGFIVYIIPKEED